MVLVVVVIGIAMTDIHLLHTKHVLIQYSAGYHDKVKFRVEVNWSDSASSSGTLCVSVNTIEHSHLWIFGRFG